MHMHMHMCMYVHVHVHAHVHAHVCAHVHVHVYTAAIPHVQLHSLTHPSHTRVHPPQVLALHALVRRGVNGLTYDTPLAACEDYADGAWIEGSCDGGYHYADSTCDYACLLTEVRVV